MHLFLASGGISTEARLAAFRLAWSRFLPAGARVLFVPYAVLDHDAYTERISRRLLPGCALDGLHRKRDPRRALLEAEAVFVGGGARLFRRGQKAVDFMPGARLTPLFR